MLAVTNTSLVVPRSFFVTIAKFGIVTDMKKTVLKNIVWKEGKHYVAQSLNVDVASFGVTKKDALANLHEALELYFEDTKKPLFSKVEQPEVVTLRYA